MNLKNTKTFKICGIVSLVLVVLVMIVCVVSCHITATMTYEEKVSVFAEENKKLSKNQIVFLGDSITEKYKINRYYRDLELDCYNRGISGDTTTWMLSRLQISIFDIAPSTIILMIGTNDINNNRTPDEIAETYDTILHLISSNLPNTKIYSVSIIPQNNEYSSNAYDNNVCIMETNNKIKNLVEKYNYEYVNLYDSLVDVDGLLKEEYSNDGLHLNSRGYRVWTSVMKKILI